MAYTVREETDMKIPASKVPAQVWADRARAHYGNLKKMEKDVLGYWEENKQVYRMNDALWDEMSIDEAEEFPMSLLDRLPYDCVFIQHRETIEIPFVFRGHELSGTVEREGYFCFRDAEGFHIAALNGQVDFMMGMDNTIAPIPITLEDYKSIGDCKDAAAIGTLAIAEEAKIKMAARPDGMWHPMSGAAIGTGTGPARGRTPPASKSSGSRRQS